MVAGKTPMDAAAAAATKSTMNHGIVATKSKRPRAPALRCETYNAAPAAIGSIASVRASFTIVAIWPAAGAYAYPAASTDDVSLIAVPAQVPNVASLR